jgi:hypothetical protein
MNAHRIAFLAGLALAACSSESEDCGTPADPSGTWDYSATQSTPAATVTGTWVLSHPETCRIGGTFSATVDEGDGSPGLLSGSVSGIFLDETHAEIHLYPAGGGDRVHLGTFVADTLAGSWEQPGAGAGVSGSFRLERNAP